MRDRRTALVAGLAGYAALVVVLLHRHERLAPLVLVAAAAAVYLVLVLLARRAAPTVSPRALALLVLAGCAVLQVAALTARPTTSDDVNRYVWDGRVQLAGVDPYAYPPAAPALDRLRDPTLFPARPCPHPLPDGGCTLINRPTVRTVYPPAAQLSFDAARLLSGGGRGGALPFQVLAALGVLATTGLLLRRRLARGDPVWPVALWAWSPLVVVEYGNNAHLDWLAVLLVLATLAAARAGHGGRTGALLALATLTKLYPALVAPAVLRRHPVRVIGAAVATAAALYLPHVLAAGTDVVGYLPGYLHEEGYDSGSRLLLLGLVLPHPFDTVAAAVLLLGVALWCLRHADPAAPERTAVVMAGAVLLVTTPAYGWYAGLLLALCVSAGRWEWVPVTLAPTVVYLYRAEVDHAAGPAAAVYATAAALALLLALARRRAAPRPPAPAAGVTAARTG